MNCNSKIPEDIKDLNQRLGSKDEMESEMMNNLRKYEGMDLLSQL